jgi:hypothetical protein
MGFFGSSTQTVVGTIVSRVISDELLPDSAQTGILNSLFQGTDINESIQESLLSSISIQADQMYRYGRDHYVHGLPSGQTMSALQGRDEITDVLETLEGATVELNYCNLGPPNSLHIAWIRLIETYGYNPDTNQLPVLSALRGYTVYLENMVLAVPSADVASYRPGTVDQWGNPPYTGYTPRRTTYTPETAAAAPDNPVYTSDGISVPEVQVTYIHLPLLEWVEENLTITLGGLNPLSDYYHVKYIVGGVTKYWMYEAGAGTYPTIDAAYLADPGINGTYLPFAHFRFNKVSDITNPTSSAYLTSKKLVKYLGIDYDQVAESIDENPDIADVEQAFIMMGVSANTTNQLELKYLYTFFENIWIQGPQFESQEAAEISIALYNEPNLARSVVLIEDARVKMALSNAGVYRYNVTGVIGPVGSYSSAYSTIMVEQGYVNEENPITVEVPVGVHTYRKQLNETQYQEIQVVALIMAYEILDGYYETAEDEEPILLIPIDLSLVEDYSFREREVLFSRSLHYVFNCAETIKLRWYETEFFQFVVMVVAITMTVASLGADGGAIIAAVVGGDVAAITIAALALLEKIVISLVVGELFQLLVKALGMDLALILAVVLAMTGFFKAINAGSIKGAPWAIELLQTANGLVKAVGANISDLMQGIADEYSSLALLQTEAEKEFERAQKLLENNTHLNPFVIFGESPDDYYNRTIHSGNVGVIGISAISTYVDQALRLPELSDTLGE